MRESPVYAQTKPALEVWGGHFQSAVEPHIPALAPKRDVSEERCTPLPVHRCVSRLCPPPDDVTAVSGRLREQDAAPPKLASRGFQDYSRARQYGCCSIAESDLIKW